MRFLKIMTLALPLLLVACGGGGGNSNNNGSSGSGSGSGETTAGSIKVQMYTGSGSSAVSVNSINASETDAHVKATVLNASGKAVPNAIVTFTQSGTLLTFSPTAATALTDSAGVANIDVAAASATSLGATAITATADVGTSSVSGSQNIAITASTLPATAKSIEFTKVVPSDKSIVLAGSGGNGRSEVALLTYTVKDANGTAVQGVTVNFAAEPAGVVTLNTTSATSNSSGQVVASVNSGSVAKAFIVKATVAGTSLSTLSDQLTVTTGIATQAGFDLSASKYNLDAALSGDSSTLTVRMVDANGNPVADGVPVVATATHGSVGSSDQGGCVTSNGACSVTYKVQNPRPQDGELVTVAFSAQTATTSSNPTGVISGYLYLNATQVSKAGLYTAATGGSALTSQAPGINASTCKLENFDLYIGTPAGLSLPAATTVDVRSVKGLSTPSIMAGSPIKDVTIGFNASNQPVKPPRNKISFGGTAEASTASRTDTWELTVTSPGGASVTIPLLVTLPACTKS